MERSCIVQLGSTSGVFFGGGASVPETNWEQFKEQVWETHNSTEVEACEEALRLRGSEHGYSEDVCLLQQYRRSFNVAVERVLLQAA